MKIVIGIDSGSEECSEEPESIQYRLHFSVHNGTSEAGNASLINLNANMTHESCKTIISHNLPVSIVKASEYSTKQKAANAASLRKSMSKQGVVWVQRHRTLFGEWIIFFLSLANESLQNITL